MAPDMRLRTNRPGTHSKTKAVKTWETGSSEKWLYFLPWLQLPREAFEDEIEAVQNWLKKPDSDPWKLDEACRHVSVPNLDVVGWYDHCNGDMLLHRTMVKEFTGVKVADELRITFMSHTERGGIICGVEVEAE